MVLYVAFAAFVIAAAAAPHKMPYVDDNVQNYLMTFGYLPQSDWETGNLRTDDQLRSAIKNLQNYGGIPVTGEIDEETTKLMSARRCGIADYSDSTYTKTRHRRYLIHGSKWPYSNLTWSLRTEQPGGLSTGGVRRELSKALDLWASNSKLTFQEINSDRADILVYFHRGDHYDGYPFDGRGQILAHAFFPGRDRGGDAHFDEEEIWLLENDTNEDGTSLFAVAAHEFGHSLGLAHSSVRGALMYPWYQGLTKDYKLPDDDRHGIEQMYGKLEDKKSWGDLPVAPPNRPPPTTSTTTTTTTPRTIAPTRRPYGTRPNHYPDDRYGGRRDRYPMKPKYPERPDYRPQRPRNPHRPHTPPTTTTTTTTTTVSPPYRPRHYTPIPRDNVPDKCDTSYDAISIIRRETFIFKGRYLWRIGDKGLYEGYPAEITRLFNLPEHIDHVDAVYERLDKKIVFFIGKYYYVFDANNLMPGYPKPISRLGLPSSLKKIDGAMVWGHNSLTYFFSGYEYWRFDESVNWVELDYPRDMKMFHGVEPNIDAVFQWKDGKTYFFKGKGYWEFDDLNMRVAHKAQKPSAQFWMGCPPEMDSNDVDLPRRSRVVLSGTQRSSRASALMVAALALLASLALRIT